MDQGQPRRPAVRWWVIALLVFTIAWAFLQTNERWVRKRLELWGVLAPDWSSGKKERGGQWAPKEFVPERAGPQLRELARWRCSLVKELAWFPDNRRMAVSAGEWLQRKGADGEPRNWCVMELPGLRDTGAGGRGGKCLEVSSRGAIALTTYRKDTRKRWSRIEAYAPNSDEPTLGLDVRGTEPPIAFTPDGARLVTIRPEGLLQVWDTESWEELTSLTLPKGDWNGMNLDIDGEGRFAVVGRPLDVGSTPLVIDLAGPRIGDPIDLPRLLLAASIPAISHDGRFIVMQNRVAGEAAAPIVYDRISKAVIWNRGWKLYNHPILHSDLLRLARFSPDDKLLAVCGDSGHVGLFDARDGALYDQHYEFDPHTTCVRWSPDGTMVAFGGDGGLVVYEVVRPPGWK